MFGLNLRRAKDAPFRADLWNWSRLSEDLFLEEEEPGDERLMFTAVTSLREVAGL